MTTTPQKNAEDVLKGDDSSLEHTDNIRKLPGNPIEDLAERMQQSRVEEQSALISMLKHRADETLLRYQALQKINTELEDQVTHCQKELGVERKRAEIFEQRFNDLAANNQAIISFMMEHKKQNAQLKLENKQLQSENNSLFSQKLHEREELVEKLTQELKLLREKYVNAENEYRVKLAGCESKLKEQAAQYEAKEAPLRYQLHDAQQQHADAVEMCKDLKLKLEDAKEQQALKEISIKEDIASLTKEKDILLSLSMERGKVIQEKQAEIQQLEAKWREDRKARIEAQDRFKLEAEAVNADARVKPLQAALKETMTKLQNLNKDFDAFKEQSVTLLTQERELNKKLRHMNG
ncbi:coiled-coil domain-containing protein 89 [Melanotaenia boesemani]|uniref:coiled-coil domain-containing protein 89 n=1 Tax=Melanotaenia boesemani TaxID=1250792 RepID=UPI001C03DBF9|nr:coiled-coil domain-containing protein 89 [Melanotaenia boesemani]